MNDFTTTVENRGYYLSVTLVERSERCGFKAESFTAFTGIKQCIKPVKRKSAKAEAEAEKLAANVMEKLIDYVCTKNKLEIKTESEQMTA